MGNCSAVLPTRQFPIPVLSGLGPSTIGPLGSLVLALPPEHQPAQCHFYLCPPYVIKGTIPNFGARNMRIGRSGTQARIGIDALGRLGPPSRPQQGARNMRIGRSGTQARAGGVWFDEWLYHLSRSARGLLAPLCSILFWGLLKLWIWAIPGPAHSTRQIRALPLCRTAYRVHRRGRTRRVPVLTNFAMACCGHKEYAWTSTGTMPC